MRRQLITVAVAALLGAALASSGARASYAAAAQVDANAKAAPVGPVFEVTVAPSLLRAPAKGRLFIFLVPGETRSEPRFGPNWFQPQPFYAIDVESWKPGQTLRLDSDAVGYPVPLYEMKPGKYTIQGSTNEE